MTIMRPLALEMDMVTVDMADRVVGMEVEVTEVAEAEEVASVAEEADGDCLGNFSDMSASYTKGVVKTGVGSGVVKSVKESAHLSIIMTYSRSDNQVEIKSIRDKMLADL